MGGLIISVSQKIFLGIHRCSRKVVELILMGPHRMLLKFVVSMLSYIWTSQDILIFGLIAGRGQTQGGSYWVYGSFYSLQSIWVLLWSKSLAINFLLLIRIEWCVFNPIFAFAFTTARCPIFAEGISTFIPYSHLRGFQLLGWCSFQEQPLFPGGYHLYGILASWDFTFDGPVGPILV